MRQTQASTAGDGAPDAMNAAWGGISEANEISMCLSAGHKAEQRPYDGLLLLVLSRRAVEGGLQDARTIGRGREGCETGG